MSSTIRWSGTYWVSPKDLKTLRWQPDNPRLAPLDARNAVIECVRIPLLPEPPPAHLGILDPDRAVCVVIEGVAERRDPAVVARTTAAKQRGVSKVACAKAFRRIQAARVAAAKQREASKGEASKVAKATTRAQRQHLTEGQRAMAVAKLYPDPENGEKKNGEKNEIVLGDISRANLSRARTVLRWLPVIADLVMAGTKSLHAAYAEAQRLKKLAMTSAKENLERVRAAEQRVARNMTDEIAWRCEGWQAGYARLWFYETWLDEIIPTKCVECDGEIWFNGRNYYCESCGQIAASDRGVRSVQISAMPWPGATFSIAPVDRWYEDETALYRIPAALNWPHGRVRPIVNRLAEGKPRADGGYGKH